MTSSCVFVVEDDSWYADFLEYQILNDPLLTAEKFSSGRECLKNMYKRPLAITLDFSLPDLSGREVLKKIRESHPEIPVIIISGQEDISIAIDLLRDGAYDYIVKDDNTRKKLLNVIRNIRENAHLKTEVEELKKEVVKKYDFSNSIIGNSKVLKDVFAKIEKAAGSNITVSVTGETGTGKELVAKAIHYNSSRKKHPLIALNLGAIPSELVESELFGHEKGSFTGAISRRTGKFEEAHKGTLFLDEIAEIDLNMQAKLLRVIEERELTRIGSNQTVKVDVRIVTATHKNLAEEVKKGNFRADLFYRLAGFPIHLPPLRERGKDILILAKHFADNFCSENGRKRVTFTEEAQNKLLSYPYPGNIRELKSIIEVSVILSDKVVIDSGDLSIAGSVKGTDLLLKELSLDDYTREIVAHYLEKYNGKVMTVARKLGIGKSTLYRMMDRYDLNPNA